MQRNPRQWMQIIYKNRKRLTLGSDNRAESTKHNKATSARHRTPEKRRMFPRKPVYIIAFILMALAAAGFLALMIVTDMLPSDLTVILAVTVIVLLMLTCFLFASGRRWKRVTGIFLAIIFIGILAFVTNFMESTYAMLNKISGGTVDAVGPVAERVSVTEEAFNVYLTGIDQWESERGYDLERSDVNMIMTINPKTKRILLTSIPRDAYVKLHTAQQMDKLTHTGVYGVDETLNTVEDWLGIDLNYYVKMNFSAAKDIINAMDGIKVYSPVAFESSLKGYKYKKGWNKMGGSKALYFARERHAFEGQDSIRVENQQRVIKAIIKKLTSSSTLIMKYGEIMEAAGDNLATNMPAEDMAELAKMQITELCDWDVETQKIDGEYDMDYVASLTQSQKFQVYRPNQESVSKCVKAIDNVINPKLSELEDADKNRSKSFVINMADRAYDRIKDAISKEEE